MKKKPFKHNTAGKSQIDMHIDKGLVVSHNETYLNIQTPKLLIITTVDSGKFQVLGTIGFISNYQLFEL